MTSKKVRFIPMPDDGFGLVHEFDGERYSIYADQMTTEKKADEMAADLKKQGFKTHVVQIGKNWTVWRRKK